MKRIAASLSVLSLFSAACSGGGGGGGGVPPTPTPPPRPGYVALRNQDTFSIAVADGSALADVAAPAGAKTLVGFSAADDAVFEVATSTTAGDLYAAHVDGTQVRLLATGISATFDWADATHLLAQKGPGPDVTLDPRRDLYVVPLDGSGEIALASDAKDEEFGGLMNGKVVFRRGQLGSNEGDLWAVDALGGSPVQLTSATGPEVFHGFTPSGRVIYTGLTGANQDLFSVKLDASAQTTLANGPDPEVPVAIVGERVVFSVVVPAGTVTENDVRAVNSDGTGATALAAVTGQTESVLAITPSGRVVFTRETDPTPPPVFELLSVPLTGGSETDLGAFSNAGLTAVDGETLIYTSGTPGSTDLHAIGADGSGAKSLTTGGVNPVFHALAAGRVIFGANDTGGSEKLWSVPVAGGNPVQLRTDAGADGFDAALAGFVVMTVPGAGSKPDLAAVNVDGSGLRTLANDPDSEQFRALTPDGRIVFSRRMGVFLDDLWIVGADGVGPVNLTNRTDADLYLGFLP